MKLEFHKIIFTSYSEVILSLRVSGRKKPHQDQSNLCLQPPQELMPCSSMHPKNPTNHQVDAYNNLPFFAIFSQTDCHAGPVSTQFL
jgi:hypothetical protein